MTRASQESYTTIRAGNSLTCSLRRIHFASYSESPTPTATLDGAGQLGLADDLGSIEQGKLADLVILNRNPLENIRNTNSVAFVINNGEVFEGETLNQIWPEKKELEPLWWWGVIPSRSRLCRIDNDEASPRGVEPLFPP